MMIREALDVFWRSLKDVWEELIPLALVNLIWFVSWAGPFALIPSAKAPWLTYSTCREWGGEILDAKPDFV